MTRTTATVPVVWPTFLCRDARAELRFLVDAFGFTERAVHADGDTVHHAELTWPGPDGAAAGGVMLGSVMPGPDPCGQPPGGSTVHVVVDDPDALHARAVAAGAVVVRELENTDYGSRQFIVRDPEGNVWSFGTASSPPGLPPGDHRAGGSRAASRHPQWRTSPSGGG